MKERWQSVALLLLIAFVFGYILGHSSILPKAHALSEGAAGRGVCVMGEVSNRYAPIVLVDTLEQSILVYEYSHNSRRLELESARSYRFDKQLMEFEISGPSVGQIRARVEQQRR